MEKIHIADSKHGKGVFASRDIKKGEFILIPHGKEIGYEESVDPDIENHAMQIDHDKYLIPSNESRDYDFLVNHSCNPNSGIRGDRTIVSIRDIKKGEEIRFDYSTCMGDGSWTLRCDCGEKSCRNIIRDFIHLPESLQEEYIKMDIVPEWILKNTKLVIHR